MNAQTPLGFAFAMFALAGPICVNASEWPQCPDHLMLREVRLESLPEGWQQEPTKRVNLDGMEFFVGPPSNTVELSEPRITDTPEASTEHWILDPHAPIWITCVYDNRAVVISRPLPRPANWCKVILPGPKAAIDARITLACHAP